MGRGAVVVKLGRLRGADAGKAQLAGTLTHIERLGVADLEGGAIDHYHTGTADVDEAQLAALQEVADTEGLAQRVREAESGLYRHHATEHDAVDVAVGHGQLVRREDLFYQEFTAQALSVQLFGMIAVDTLTNLHN
ncbi:hypothetical protein D3C72_1754140 [compost metagenome]